MSFITQVLPQTAVTPPPLEKSDQQKDILTQARPLMDSNEEFRPTESLINELFCLLSAPGYNKLEKINKFIADNQQDSRGYAFEQYPPGMSLQSQKISFEEKGMVPDETASQGVAPDETASQSITTQKLLVEKGDDAIEDISFKTRNDIIKNKASQSKLTAKRIKQEINSDKNTHEQITTGTSYAELWARVSTMIGSIKSDYVDFYADLMQKYTSMYEAFNTTVQKASSDAVTSGQDGNSVTFNRFLMEKGYIEFDNEVKKIDLGSVENWKKMSQEEQKSLVTTLEPAFKVNLEGKIEFHLKQYNSSVKDKYPGTSSGNISTASYQAWLATFNSAGSALQSNMQAFSQRYTQANSTFDQLNKMLSGVINSLGDSAKDVLKSLS